MEKIIRSLKTLSTMSIHYLLRKIKGLLLSMKTMEDIGMFRKPKNLEDLKV